MSETTITQPEVKADTNLSFNPNDFAADIEKLAKAQGMSIEPPPPAVSITPPVTPEQPVEQAPVTTTNEATKVEVPEKFKTADGNLDESKLAKSTQSVEEALAKYLEMEKELKRKINDVKKQENAYLTPPTTTPQAPVQQISPDFAKQLEADIQRDGAGIVLAKLFSAAQESVEERVNKEITSLKNVNAENASKQQIEAIGKNDPWVYTPDGMATLTRTLEEQPYLMQARDPYKAAYLFYRGLNNVASKSNSQVLISTPPARASAPVPTAQAVNQTSAPVIKLDTKQDIDNHLKKLTAAQQSEFFKKMGYPGF